MEEEKGVIKHAEQSEPSQLIEAKNIVVEKSTTIGGAQTTGPPTFAGESPTKT